MEVLMDQPRHPTLIPLPDEWRTERIVIRPYRATDAEGLFAAIDESRATLAPWLPWVDHHERADDTRDFCLRSLANWIARTTLEVGIFDAHDGTPLGATGFPRLDWRARTFEIGYWLRLSTTGHGYISEAVRELTRFAFAELAANRVEIRCDARNERSRHVAERLGFLREGCLRSNELDPTGQPRDTLVFALIPEDYRRVSAEWAHRTGATAG
jgi:RimJ/RimL family protein N-acetyltransferase